MSDTLRAWLGEQDIRLRQYVDKMMQKYGMSESATLKTLLYRTMDEEPMLKLLKEMRVDIDEMKKLLKETKDGGQ